MPHIIYVEYDGSRHCVEVPVGSSLMEGAVCNRVPGILARCGGAGGCATCQVYLDGAWNDRIGPASRAEIRTLRFAHAPNPTSRLSCQIRVTEDLDGLVLHMPSRQF